MAQEHVSSVQKFSKVLSDPAEIAIIANARQKMSGIQTDRGRTLSGYLAISSSDWRFRVRPFWIRARAIAISACSPGNGVRKSAGIDNDPAVIELDRFKGCRVYEGDIPGLRS